MKKVIFFISAFLSFGVMAEECPVKYKEADFLAAIGKEPEKMQVLKDDGMVRHQYFFRKELTDEEAFEEGSKAQYEPQLYVTIYEPPCPEKISIFFFGNEDKSMNEVNVALAGKAFEYLTGTSSTIFANKMEKFKGVQRFESNDEKADSVFAKTDNSYSIQIQLK